jgi:hypothetical protein
MGKTAMLKNTLKKHQPVIKNRIGSGRQTRKNTGAVIAEFGPAVWVFILGFFFPLLVLISMVCSYGSLMVLNNLQVHEAALLPSGDAQDPSGSVMSIIPNNWKNDGLGRFVQLVGFPATSVTYKMGQIDQNNVQDKIVQVVTTASISPLVFVPFGPSMPGLSAPVTFTLISDKLVENQDNAP